jgi:hypothetical protein
MKSQASSVKPVLHEANDQLTSILVQQTLRVRQSKVLEVDQSIRLLSRTDDDD